MRVTVYPTLSLSKDPFLLRRCSRCSCKPSSPLANPDPAPAYSSALRDAHTALRTMEGRQGNDDMTIQSVARSARYPRVAVILGVPSKWHIPLLLCRSLSTISAIWWVCQTLLSIYRIAYHPQTDLRLKDSYFDHDIISNRTFKRVAVAQVCLSFLWV